MILSGKGGIRGGFNIPQGSELEKLLTVIDLSEFFGSDMDY